jgi:hypothetical protein
MRMILDERSTEKLKRAMIYPGKQIC